MRRISIALAAMLLSAQFALAQQPGAPPPHPHGGAPLERLARDLGLNEGQKADLKRIFDEQKAKREAEREQYKVSGQHPTPEQMHAFMQQTHQEMLQELSGVLTPEQLTKFKQIEAARRGRWHQPPPPAAASSEKQ